MFLKLMYITNRRDVAQIAEKAGVDRIFVDMEYIGKTLRQGGMDSVQNHHTIEDVRNIRKVLTKSELLVRVNPIHEKTDEYFGSEEEIEAVIEAGADVVMLPYFKTIEEVRKFVTYVGGRAKVLLLLETRQLLLPLVMLLLLMFIHSQVSSRVELVIMRCGCLLNRFLLLWLRALLITTSLRKNLLTREQSEVSRLMNPTTLLLPHLLVQLLFLELTSVLTMVFAGLMT